ncbi:PREDICTED: membrane cofactor protein [Tauraco erythrolophus]|uniref:membrane cofactor protein n=1 Tax=Tauraco erythrolophus TaxID=121530 RepID=UPI000523712A|nr:PREDICTED: membrane cofactor protein [Tauraco erythrolophus]
MPGCLRWPGRLLAAVVLVLQLAGSLEAECPVPDITHGQLHLAENFTYGSTAKLECDAGYIPVGATTIVQCPSPAIHHGREITPRKAEYTFGHYVELRCDPSYVLRGNGRIQCWSDGTWKPPVPHCDKVCGPPPRITNGQHSGFGPDPFTYGVQVKYRCVEGLSLIGDDTIYCTSDDGVNLTWSGPAPECRGEPVLCPQPQVANGRLKSTLDSKTWYQINATVTFECLHGYDFSDNGDMSLEDPGTATCLPDGSWTPLPKCKKEGDADVCEEIHHIKTVSECGVPIADLKTLLEIQKLFMEIKKLKLESEYWN